LVRVMLSLGLGLGLAQSSDADAALLSSIVNNPNYTASVAGTNVATTRATELLCPFTGTALANNVPCTRRIYLGGKAHDAFGAWPQATNLTGAISTNVGLASNTLSGIVRTITEDTAATAHTMASASAFTLTNATNYTVQATVRRVSGATPWVMIYFKAGANIAGVSVNVETGAVGNPNAGNGTSTRQVLSLGGGKFKISALISSEAWGGTGLLTVATSNAETPDTHTGDGSIFEITGAAVHALLIPVPPLGEASTVNENQHVMTTGVGLSGAILACAVPIYWSSSAGSAHPSMQSARITDYQAGNDALLKSTSDISQKTDTTLQSASAAALAMSASVPTTRFQSWDTNYLRLFRDGVQAAEDATLAGPWVARTSFRVGGSSAANRTFYGLVLVGVCNGFIPSAAAMAAWHRSVVRALTPLSVPIL
jgi:hypothetical protein